MKYKRKILAVVCAGLWITLSEFIRNEFLFKGFWIEHFRSLGLVFATLPVNGLLWLVWSLLLAYVIYRLSDKFSPKEVLFISWLAGFVMMWIAAYNLQVMSLGLLIIDLPLSLLEIAVAQYIIVRLRNLK
ncbi:MAG: hypothetical protein WCO55_02955 [Candidatus Falkowbacteria bacterium]